MKPRLFAGLFCALVGAASLRAATLTVTNAHDSGPGSLRDTIALAAPGDEIVFDPGLSPMQIVLTTGELVVDKDLTITGLGPESTVVDGRHAEGVFLVREGPEVRISGITITGGGYDQSCGLLGGIHSQGTLVLRNCVIRANHGCGGMGIDSSGSLTITACTIVDNASMWGTAAVVSMGSLTVTDSLFEGNRADYGGPGGAIYSSGPTLIMDSEFRNNHALMIGAISSSGPLTLVRTVVAGNGVAAIKSRDLTLVDSWVTGNGGYATVQAGGHSAIIRSTIEGNTTWGHLDYNGPAVYSYGDDLKVENSTISHNSGGGISGEAVSLINSTVVGNRYSRYYGGLDGSGTVKNSVVAGNYSNPDRAAPETPDDCHGSFVSGGHNFLGNAGGCPGIVDGVKGDVTGVEWAQIVESEQRPWGRVPLTADNGGPTPTMALLPGSSAVDHIPPEDCTDLEGKPLASDQRGIPRPQGAGCDVGAFELAAPRGAGFWAHQCSNRGFRQVSREEMEAFFREIEAASSVFPECAPAGCETLDPPAPRNDIRARAQQALLDVWLNLVSGRLTRGRPIDLPDLTAATSVGDAISQMEVTVCDPEATRSDLGNAKDLAEALNGSADDMEWAASDSAVTIRPGATQTITLGLVNVSQGTRNYSLTASGPWPVRLSAPRINALRSGQVAELTATITAPPDTQAARGIVHITAADLLSQGTLSRDVMIRLDLAPPAPPKGQPAQKPTQVD